MVEERANLFYWYSQSRGQWVLSYSESPGLFNALLGVHQENVNGRPYWFLTQENLNKNLVFLRAVGYRLHERSPIDESGEAREVASSSVSMPTARFVVKPASTRVPGSQESPYRISQITKSLGDAVEQVFGKSYLWVEGEISGFKRTPSGTCFFTLLETQNGEAKYQIRAQIWNQTWREICDTFESYERPYPKDGDKVSVQCEVNYYRPQNTISLQVQQFDLHFGEGEFLRKKREIIERLKEEGLFYLNKSLPDPELPFRIAVFSNETAAGYTDFLSGLVESQYPFKLTLFKISLQGTNVEASFMSAMRELRAIGESQFDYGVILRGGGAVTDLAWFNNYEIAKVVSHSKLKFIAGIGHKKDSTVLDDMLISAMTPTAARDFLTDRARLAEGALDDLESQLIHACEGHLRELQDALKDLSNELTKRSTRAFHNEETELLRRQNALTLAVQTSFDRQARELESLKKALNIRTLSANNVAELNLKLAVTNLNNAVKESMRSRSSALLMTMNALKHDVQTQIHAEEGRLQLRINDIANMAHSKERSCYQALNERADALRQVVKARIENKQKELALFEKLITAQDPREIMKRGFVCLSGADGRPVTRVDGLNASDKLKATLIDGSLELSILTIRKAHNG